MYIALMSTHMGQNNKQAPNQGTFFLFVSTVTGFYLHVETKSFTHAKFATENQTHTLLDD